MGQTPQLPDSLIYIGHLAPIIPTDIVGVAGRRLQVQRTSQICPLYNAPFHTLRIRIILTAACLENINEPAGCSAYSGAQINI